MLLVRSHLDNGNEAKSREIMAEIVRTFEDEYPVTTDSYHPRVVDLYKGVFRSMKDRRTATVTITSNPPGCDVFINGRAMKQKTPFTFKGLYPGGMRVNVRKGELQSMVRKVEVGANGSGKVDIDLEYESALTFNDDTFGLTFSDKAAMKRNMLNYAVKLGKFLEVDYVVMGGVLKGAASPVLSGYQFDVSKRKLVRHKDFVVKANVVSARRISELSAFIADVNLDVVKGAVFKPWYTNWVGWSLTGLTVAMGGVSLAFFLKFNEHKDNAQNVNFGSHQDRVEQANLGNDAQTNAGIFAGLAAASAVGTVLVFTLVKFEEPAVSGLNAPATPRFIASPMVVPGGGGVAAQWSF